MKDNGIYFHDHYIGFLFCSVAASFFKTISRCDICRCLSLSFFCQFVVTSHLTNEGQSPSGSMEDVRDFSCKFGILS